MDNATEPLATGVWRIEIAWWVNAYLLANDGSSDQGGLTVVDPGPRRSGPRLVRSIRLLGFDPRAVTGIILTHWHADHGGSAARFRHSSAAPTISAGSRDLPAIRGRDPSPQRSAAAEDVSRLGRLIAPALRPGPPVPDARALAHGALLPVAGGARVVATPGHTAGSLSLLLGERGVLLAGDTVMCLPWLSRGITATCSRLTQRRASLRTLAALDFDVLAPGHGPPLVRDARRRLERLAAGS